MICLPKHFYSTEKKSSRSRFGYFLPTILSNLSHTNSMEDRSGDWGDQVIIFKILLLSWNVVLLKAYFFPIMYKPDFIACLCKNHIFPFSLFSLTWIKSQVLSTHKNPQTITDPRSLLNFWNYTFIVMSFSGISFFIYTILLLLKIQIRTRLHDVYIATV